jgi:hypothetical protein
MEGVDWTKERNFYVLLNDAPGAYAYPIMATSFALVRRYPSDAARSRDTLAFFGWAIEHGQSIADSLHHVPLHRHSCSRSRATGKRTYGGGGPRRRPGDEAWPSRFSEDVRGGAVATTGSPKTVPHSAKPRFEVKIIAPFS